MTAAKKAAETAAKTAISTVSRQTQRAVTAAEARTVTPAKESSTETQMPWNGWFSSFLADKLGPERYEKLRRIVLYKPDDIHGLNQIPMPGTKVPLTDDKDGPTAQFRHPSPGSAGPVRIPSEPLDDDPFDAGFYKTDTSRRHSGDPANLNSEIQKMKIAMLPQDDPRVQEYKEKIDNPGSSPGNKGVFATGPSDFDPTGLRATMSATNEAMNESLDAHMPDHLPVPEWMDRQEEIIKWYEDRDLPIPFGGTGHDTVPREGRIAKW